MARGGSAPGRDRCAPTGAACHDARPVSEHTGSWKGVLFGVGIAAFAAYQQFKLPVVLPVLLERYGYDRVLAGGFMSVYALTGLMLSVWLGGVIERRGATGPVLIAMGLLAAGSALSLAFPASGMLMLAGRALEGCGFAAVAVVGPVLASANAPPRSIAIVAGLAAAWIPIGQLSATAVAPLALATGGWSVLWWLGIAGAALVALWMLTLRQNPQVLLSAARAGSGATSRRIAARERNTLILVACIFGLWSGQYFAYMTWMPQYLVEVHGLAVKSALLSYVVPVIFVALFNVLGGVLLRQGVALGALLGGAVGAQTLVWWLVPLTGDDWTGLLSLAVYGISAGMVPTCLFASPNAVLGPGRSTARAFGIIMTGRNLGVLTGPVLMALVAGDGERWSEGSRLFAGLTSVCLLLAFALCARLHGSSNAP